MKNEIVIISLGGSLIFPDEIDVEFLKKFKALILKYVKKGKRFVIITGGGKICRRYQNAAYEISKIPDVEKDWVGLHVTRMNARFMRAVFYKESDPHIVKNPTEKIKFKGKILLGAGWRPGCSSDYDAILLARNLKIKKMVNMSNIDFVCDKDPNKFKDAKPINNITWKDFRKLLPEKWNPGANVPFDPVAAKEADKLGMEIAILNGKNLENLEKYLDGADFKGTKIHP